MSKKPRSPRLVGLDHLPDSVSWRWVRSVRSTLEICLVFRGRQPTDDEIQRMLAEATDTAFDAWTVEGWRTDRCLLTQKQHRNFIVRIAT